MDFIVFVWLILGIGILALAVWIYEDEKASRGYVSRRQYRRYQRTQRNKNKR